MSTAGDLMWAIPEAHPGGVTALVSVPEKEMIVTGGEHGEVRTWNVRTRQMKAHLKLHTVRRLKQSQSRLDEKVINASNPIFGYPNTA